MNPTLQKTLCFSGIVPNTVNRAARHRLDASGKGVNVCRVLTQLGKPAAHLCSLGGSLRPLFLELCAQDGLGVQWVDSGSPIRFCYTLIDEAAGTITEFVEEALPVAPGTEAALLAAYTRLLPAYTTVIISGTKAAGFSDALVPEMARQAVETGRRLILDLRGKDLLGCLPFGPDVIKPNLFEFASTFAPELILRNEVIDDGEVLKTRLRELCRDLCVQYRTRVVLTRGSRPVWYAQGEDFAEFPFEPLRAVNSAGSGDAFTAGLAAALDEGASLRDAVARGIHCGRLNAACFKIGVISEP
jgi:fructose-1-phosphate kinase PfkB-like protein